MFLSTTKVEDFDAFLQTFSTEGAAKRRQHGSRGSTIFRDPEDAERIWVVFDWSTDGWQGFLSDPDVPAIFQAAGLTARPEMLEVAARYDC